MSARPGDREALRCLLEPRSIAVVGASPRPGSFGERMVTEVLRSPADISVHLVNPRYAEIAGRPCFPSLAEIGDAIDLVLLGVGDGALEGELSIAAKRGDRAAVIFGNAYEPPIDGLPSLRTRLAAIARDASMQLCGGGCMGFVNVTSGVRAMGYLEPDPIPPGPVAMVTHSGSVFSAVLRARRGLGFTLAVSSGQELVTTTAAYLEYMLALERTQVVALVLETMRETLALRAALDRAAEQEVPVVVLPVGTSERGRSMVAAHSGAVAGGTAAWEALADAHGLHLVADLGELLDTVELFAAGRRARPRRGPASGIAAVLDSGAERALIVDVAAAARVPFAEVSEPTLAQVAERLDPGLIATNPLDVWGNGADTEDLFGDVLLDLAGDDDVRAVALAVDLIEELDGDESYRDAVRRAAAGTELPVVVLSHMPSALDLRAAAQLRAAGIPVLEGTRSGLRALGHLLDHGDRRWSAPPPTIDEARRARWRERLSTGLRSTAERFALLADYGIDVATTHAVDHEGAVLAAGSAIGYPVVLKTDEDIAHKTDVGGVVVGIGNDDELMAAYRDLRERLGPRAVVSRQVPPGVEILLGAVRDPNLGPILLLGAGGLLVEQVADRAATLPPLDAGHARELIARTLVERLLVAPRHGPPADVDAVARAAAALSQLVIELGEDLDAIEVNPLVCSDSGAVAVDVHLELTAPKGLAADPR
ncbi:MAG TPA: acetate--CoA ligase family protein [Mycobacteriales bacterium]|nr:acetate--CoA ligase family protein [Mycobacteriales bacterium]